MRTLGELRSHYRTAAMARDLNPRDVDLLLSTAIGKPLTFLIAHDEYELTQDERSKFDAFIERRLDGEPVQYLRGFTEFYGRDFRVDSRGLIPRPETEFVVEQTLLRCGEHARVVDVGTGSGCIAVSLKLERPSTFVAATDISFEAITLARENARRLGATIEFSVGDTAEAMRGEFDVLASNPPYIPSNDVPHLSREVREFEPYCALTPGSKGTEVIDKLFAAAHRLLRPDGFLIFEMGYSQEESVRNLAGARGIEVVEVVCDLAGIPRVVVCRPPLR